MGHAGPTRVITGCYLARRTCSRTNTRTHARTKVSEGGGGEGVAASTGQANMVITSVWESWKKLSEKEMRK